jgi:hypothetical protein
MSIPSREDLAPIIKGWTFEILKILFTTWYLYLNNDGHKTYLKLERRKS